jgi:molybdopterin molybdotransferase
MALLPVAEALQRILEGVQSLASEEVGLLHARGRTLAKQITAKFDNPPFDASAMVTPCARKTRPSHLPRSK